MSLQRSGIVVIALAAFGPLMMASAAFDDEPERIKLADAPAAVKKTFETEAKGTKVETIIKETEDELTTYSAKVVIAGKTYHVEVGENGTLLDISLDIGDERIAFSAAPAPVQAAFRKEAKDAKFGEILKGLKHGLVMYTTDVTIGKHAYSILVTETGLLFTKTLLLTQDDVEIGHCPAAVQKALKDEAKGGTIGEISKESGLGKTVYATVVEIGDKSYDLEVSETGTLLSKSIVGLDD